MALILGPLLFCELLCRDVDFRQTCSGPLPPSIILTFSVSLFSHLPSTHLPQNSATESKQRCKRFGAERWPSMNFYRAMLCIRGTSHGPVCVCVCPCLSVTSRSSTKTITQTTPHSIPGTLVFRCQRSPQNSRAPNAGGVGQNR